MTLLGKIALEVREKRIFALCHALKKEVESQEFRKVSLRTAHPP
jgi:hypothetical protein